MLSVQEYKTKIVDIIDQLPDEKIEELFDYAEFLGARCLKQTKSEVDKESLMLQQEALKKIWDNPEEDIYDL